MPVSAAVLDRLQRPLRSLRISVTDRCNLRCRYCMPERDYVWMPREQILTFEELDTLVREFVRLGVTKIRLTGGEPLVREDLAVLVRLLAAQSGIHDLALTTNGVLLAQQARRLAEAGLRRVTVSLDTLRPERFKVLTGTDALSRVLGGIAAARAAGFSGLKFNMVVLRGFNDDELPALLEFGRANGAEVRFIEYMDVGGATQWSPEQVVSQREMLERLAQRYGAIGPLDQSEPAPAGRYRLADGTVFGVIPSTTTPFCRSCERSRLTADGMWYLCLYATHGLDLRAALRSGRGPGDIAALLAATWEQRVDRGAEQRLAVPDRGPFVPLTVLRSDYHLEMHTRGG